MKLRTSLASALVLLACLSTVRAQTTLYWDINGANAGATDDVGGLATGTWESLVASPEDYNGDGLVDAADYVLWRHSPGDFGGPNGYDAWAAAFGETAGGAGNWNTVANGTGATVGWTSGATAVFSAGTNATGNYTVTLSGTQSASGVTFDEGTVTLSGGQLDLTGASTITTISGTTSTINSVVGGSVTLTKAGADRLVLGGANVYSGGTNIDAGTLQFGITNGMPVSGEVTVGTGATLAVNAGGAGQWSDATSGGGSIGGLIAGTGGQGTANQVSWIDGSRLGIDTTNATDGLLTYSGVIGSFRTTSGTTNAVGLTKRGAGTLALNAANTYTGNTTMAVNSGILKLEAANTLPAATVLVLPPANGGAVVELFNSSNNYFNQTVAGLSGGGIGTASPTVVDVGFATLTIDVPTGQSHTYNGYLKTDFTSPTVRGKVIKDGAGELILGGANNNTSFGFAGEFIMNAGRLVAANNAVFGVNNELTRPSTLTLNGGTLVKGNDINSSLNLTPRTVDITGSFTFDMTDSQSDAQLFPALAGSGVGGINLKANVTINVTSPVDPSFIFNTPLGYTPAFILGRPITDGTNSFSITKDGPGLLRLNQTNDFNGGVTILAGTLSVAAAAGSLGDGPVFLSGGTLNFTGAGGTYTLNNDITVTADSAINLRGGTGGSGQTPGREFIFTTNNFSGTGGTLTLRNDSNSNEPNSGNPVQNPLLFTVTFTGQFDFDRPVVIANHPPIPGHPEFDIVTTNRATVLNSANTSGVQTWSGDISGNGGFVRNGGGTTVLSGNNTYTGDTIINAGTLSITNPYLHDSADVLLTTGSIFDLDFMATDTIDQLFIDGAPQASGTYGFTAMNPGGLFTGTGLLFVSASGSGGGSAVPEPGSLALVMMAVFAVGVCRHRHG